MTPSLLPPTGVRRPGYQLRQRARHRNGLHLDTKDGGTVYFFSMATSFTAVALGAEGSAHQHAYWYGYTRHAATALEVLREKPACQYFGLPKWLCSCSLIDKPKVFSYGPAQRPHAYP